MNDFFNGSWVYIAFSLGFAAAACAAWGGWVKDKKGKSIRFFAFYSFLSILQALYAIHKSLDMIYEALSNASK